MTTIAEHVMDGLHEKLMAGLEDLGIWLHNQAKTTSSRYYRFECKDVGSLRLGDHPGRRKYRHRWNLWVDPLDRERLEFDGNAKRYHYGAHEVDALIEHIHRYAREIDPNSTDYVDPIAAVLSAAESPPI